MFYTNLKKTSLIYKILALAVFFACFVLFYIVAPTNAQAGSASVSSINFGNVIMGQSTNRTFTVSVGGTASEGSNYSVSNGGTYFTCISNCFGYLAPGGSRTVTIRFSPIAIQSYSSTISVSWSAFGTSNAVTVLGNGVDQPPAMAVTPASRDFGSVTVGSSADLTFTVQNTGGGTLTGYVTVVGSYSCVGGCTLNLAGGAQQVATIRYTPTGYVTDTRNVNFVFNEGTNINRQVTGTGVSGLTNPDLQITNSIQIIDPSLTSPWDIRRITVRNTGDGQLSYSVGGLNGIPFSCRVNCSGTLSAAQERDIIIQTAGCGIWPNNDTVEISWSPQSLVLSPFSTPTRTTGVSQTCATPPPPPPPPAEPIVRTWPNYTTGGDFYGQTLDTTGYEYLWIYNDGNANLQGTLTEASATIPGDYAEFSCSANCTYNIAPGGSHRATISFRPTSACCKAVGNYNATFHIQALGYPGVDRYIEFRGEGRLNSFTPGSCSYINTQVDFGPCPASPPTCNMSTYGTWQSHSGGAGCQISYCQCYPPVTYNLSVNSSGASSVPITASIATYNGTTNYIRSNITSGTTIILTAPATAGGNNFSSWTGCSSTSGNNCTVSMTANRTATANYVAPTSYDLDITKAGTAASAGTIVLNPGTNCTTSCIRTYTDGTSVDLTGSISNGNVTFSGSGCSGNSCTVSMTQARSVTASFACNSGYVLSGASCVVATYSLTVNSSGASGVAITANNATYNGTTDYTRTNIPYGTSITLTAPPISGTRAFVNWSGCIPSGNNTCSVTMDMNRTMSANYELIAPLMSIDSDKQFIRSGEIPVISWSVESLYPVTCSIIGPQLTGETFDPFTDYGGIRISSGFAGPLINTSEYILSCVEPNTGESFEDTVTVEVVPDYQEI